LSNLSISQMCKYPDIRQAKGGMQNVSHYCTLRRGHDGEHRFEVGRRKSPNFGAQKKRAWDACIAKMRSEPPLPMAKKGEESCGHEWGSCTGYEGQKHSCGIVEGHKVADQRHVCGSCFAQKKRNKYDDVEDDDDG